MGMSLEITTRNKLKAPLAYDEVFITWLPTEGKESVLAKDGGAATRRVSG